MMATPDLVRRVSKQAQAYVVARRGGEKDRRLEGQLYAELADLVDQLAGRVDHFGGVPDKDGRHCFIAAAAIEYVTSRRGGVRTIDATVACFEALRGLCEHALRISTPAAPSPDAEPARPWWDRD